MNVQSQIKAIECLSSIIEIAAGSQHSIALSGSGMWVWGKADGCNLTLPSAQSIIKQPHFVNIDADHACAGEDHSFVWKNNEVYCWGSNRSYKLGFQQVREYGLTKSQIFTEAIQSDMELCQITCGDSHSLAVTQIIFEALHYQIFAWGESKSYQLALETEGAVSEPIMIDFEEPVQQIYTRNDYNFVITKTGQVYSWGTNIFGRLGFANLIKNQKFPTLVKTLPKIKTIAMGKYHCVGITESNQGYSWGHGMHGQLGLNQIKTPTKIPLTDRIIQAACGEQHTIILTQNNTLMSCGSNAYAALGHDEVDQTKRCKKFTIIKQFDYDHVKIMKIVCGNRHNLMLTSDGKVYSWGCNKFGQLGRQTEKQQIKIKRQLYKQQIYQIKKQVEPDIRKLKSHQNQLISQQFVGSNKLLNSNQNSNSNTKLKIEGWKLKFQNFQMEKQRQQSYLIRELEQILQGIK